LLFSRASTDNGNLQPTTINMGITIGALLLDAANDQLYASDPADNVVDRLDNASAQNTVGIVGAAIAGPDTLLSQPRGLALDGSGRLLVGNSAAPVSITTYGSAGVGTGDLVPFATISGSNTQLQSPQQMVLNGNILNGELYVVDPVAASILIYTNTSTVTGNLAPARVINGANTGLAVNSINGIALDTTR
jgi:hypothetical protein